MARWIWILSLALGLAAAGCTRQAPPGERDPGAPRSDLQTKELRDRAVLTQGDR